MAESLNGKVAVISGVGSGFGKATAEKFAAEDQVNLVLIDRNEEKPRGHGRSVPGIRFAGRCHSRRRDQSGNL